MSTTVLATAIAMPSTRPAASGQAERSRRPRRRPAVATRLCPIAPGIATPPDRQQVVEVEVQADAEHQQDDADLGELRGRCRHRPTKPGVCGPISTPASR